MSVESLKASLRTVKDFPIEGILFWDITTLLKDPKCLKELDDTLYEMYKDKGITKVIGLESRGYIMGASLAARLGAGFIMARKKGKLPAETVSQSFRKEYGFDAIEIHTDALTKDDVVLIHDDLLALGGTSMAAVDLVRKFGIENPYVNFIIEIEELKGREKFPPEIEVTSVIKV